MGTVRSLLSPEERAFVQKYSKLKTDHFNHAVLDVAAISDHFRPLNDPAIGACVSLLHCSKSVFVRCQYPALVTQRHHQTCSSGCSAVSWKMLVTFSHSLSMLDS
jgi:hypothetical protein